LLELDKVHLGDCLELMREIPDKSIDMVLTDPPYLMNYRSNRRVKSDKFKRIENDKNSYELISDYIKECQRILKDDSAIYMFCSWHKVDFFKQEFEKCFTLKNIIVWNKNNHGSGDLKGSYAPKHEFILFGHKGRSLFKNKRVPDVIDCAKIPSPKLTHPTEKPLDLLKTFILNNSDNGGVVFDGFAGTGSTALAAKELNRRFLLIELEQEYVNIANERIKQAKEGQHGES
jgi:site-specific DNA-methyltransferase (adenine-specific)